MKTVKIVSRQPNVKAIEIPIENVYFINVQPNCTYIELYSISSIDIKLDYVVGRVNSNNYGLLLLNDLVIEFE